MNWLDATLPSPAENLALDEALLDAAEAGTLGESLRFWESVQHFVVLGYANSVSTEVDRAACERLGIPILRRVSGGGTVLQGPGVLNYSLVLRMDPQGPLNNITSANRFIMQRNADALTELLTLGGKRPSVAANPGASLSQLMSAAAVEVHGHTDLALGELKFSGNAQRRKRTHLLFHGAILLNLDLDLLDQVLPMPSLQPAYRGNRSHRAFLIQLGVLADRIKDALRTAWSADEPLDLNSRWPDWLGTVRTLVTEKYSKAEWNFRV